MISIYILLAPFYFAVANPSGLTSQMINFVQLSHPSLLGQTQATRIDGGRLRIGHTNLTHSYFMTHSLPILCMTCNIPLSVPHILLFCPCYTAARATAFPHSTRLSRPPRLNDILTKSPHFHLDNIISLLQQIHILH